jgi:hypothetical protein
MSTHTHRPTAKREQNNRKLSAAFFHDRKNKKEMIINSLAFMACFCVLMVYTAVRYPRYRLFFLFLDFLLLKPAPQFLMTAVVDKLRANHPRRSMHAPVNPRRY